MKESQCVEEQYYSESTSTEEPDYKILEVTSNGRLKGFFVSGNVVNLSNCKLSQAKFLFFQRI